MRGLTPTRRLDASVEIGPPTIHVGPSPDQKLRPISPPRVVELEHDLREGLGLAIGLDAVLVGVVRDVASGGEAAGGVAGAARPLGCFGRAERADRSEGLQLSIVQTPASRPDGSSIATRDSSCSMWF
jgi:hypothetical protein